MEVSSRNLDEEGKIVENEAKGNFNNPKSISSHNIVPNGREFVNGDLDKWIEANIDKKIIDKNKEIADKNIKDLSIEVKPENVEKIINSIEVTN